MRTLLRMITEIGRAIRFELLSTLGTLLTIFLALTIPGLFWIASKNLVTVESGLRNSLTMDVFLKDDLASGDIERLRVELLGLPGVTEARYVSKEEALYKMRAEFGSEMIENLDENPLPASFVLRVKDVLFRPGAADSLTKTISALPGVEDVVFAGELVNQVSRIMRTVRVLGLVLSILVGFSAVFIVANTVRVAISDRRKTIEIMQLVGATRSYILTPFVSLGGILGFVGALIAIATLAWLSDYLGRHLVHVVFLEAHEVTAFLLSGLLLGMVGALVATKRNLKI